MLAFDRNAVICDLAEVYHIYDYHGVPVSLLGTLVSGLGPDSRIGMKLSGRKASMDTIMLVNICDILVAYIYSWSDKSNQKRPDPMAPRFFDQDPIKKKPHGYSSGEEFKKAWISMTNRSNEQKKDAQIEE